MGAHVLNLLTKLRKRDKNVRFFEYFYLLFIVISINFTIQKHKC